MRWSPSIGVMLPTMSPGDASPGDAIAAGRLAEELGYESVWVVDQLVAGSGVPFVDSVVALAAVAGATERVRLGFGVMILPLRSTAWIAKQVASLQFVSGGRVLFGVGVGGDRHERSWVAAGVDRRDRARRTDAALAVLADLIAGRPAALPDVPGNPTIELLPGVEVPPIVVGGGADAALHRVVRAGAGWFALPVPPVDAAPMVERLRDIATEAHRLPPPITGSIVVALDDGTESSSAHRVHARLTDPDGMYGMPADASTHMLVRDPVTLRERVDGWAALGAERIVLNIATDTWDQQARLVADALG